MKIVILGDAGSVGAKLASRLARGGHDVLLAAAESGVDTLTGVGLSKAFAGARVVVDVAAASSFPGPDCLRRSVRNVVTAEEVAGVRHHIALSVVGVDRVHDAGCFRAKWTQEMLVRSSRISNTIVRSTQLFECLGDVAQLGSEAQAVRLPPVLVQPVAADDVASALAEVATGVEMIGTMEIAGPETLYLPELCRRFLSANEDTREVIADTKAKYYGIEPAGRLLLPNPHARIGSIRFDDWIRGSPFRKRHAKKRPDVPAERRYAEDRHELQRAIDG